MESYDQFYFHESLASYGSFSKFQQKGVIQWLSGHNFDILWPPATSKWTFLALNVYKN